MKRNPLSLCSVLIAVLAITGCARESEPSNHASVTLYTSVDDQLARSIVDVFTQETGIEVQILGDTEATKTTGLVSRLEAEMDHPRADVWWSSEPMGTILLAQRGVLEPGAMEGMVDDDWPEALRGNNWSWIGTGLRARVIAYASDRIEAPPTTLAELTDPKYKGKIGMARPQFGTTRIHTAILLDRWGQDAFDEWLGALKANRVRLYDGNASVVKAIAMGEIDVGLTDTDDASAGQANGWRVDLVYEGIDANEPWASPGPTWIPNTVAIIKGCPNPDSASELAAFLVSARAEALLEASPSGNRSVHALLDEHAGKSPVSLDQLPDYVGAAGKVREAIDACSRVLISP
jgi:iron(III) transport system substrate-binding protein